VNAAPAAVSAAPAAPGFGWATILRLGLVQAAIGAIVVLTTSTLNRVMVVELALPALLPGVLVALHYAVQFLRPRMGFGSDASGRRTPWIVGGMALLATGGVLAAAGVAWMASQRAAGIALAVLGFVAIGVGVSAAGTSLLALLAKRVDEARRAPAATTVWMMMILGFALTAGVAGKLLDPYSPERLLAVAAAVAAGAFMLAVLALRGLEPRSPSQAAGAPAPRATPLAGEADAPRFREALASVWGEAPARRFTVFVFVSMLAFSAQDLILEPYAGSVFGWAPGQTTQLSGVQHGGVLMGMVLVALAGRGWLGRRFTSLKGWAVGGCLASGGVLALLAAGAGVGAGFPLAAVVFALGVATGAFSIAAIASMMRLAGQGAPGREGLRMGLWGAAQAFAFGLGGLVGTGASDLAHALLGAPAAAYASVFALEAVLFGLSALLAWRVDPPARPSAGGTTLELGRSAAR
jgi:BCD family chlorophyll transporter-like MFS transporter